MSVIVVTGASGLIGRAVIARLSPSHEVIAVSRRPAGTAPAKGVVVADLTDPAFVGALPQRADAVVHLAQAERYADFPEAADEVLAVNVGALAKLLDWARRAGVQHFVHTSTGGLYGRSAHPFNEGAPLRITGPLSFYFQTKRFAELLAEEYAVYFSVVALRPFFVYGREQQARMLLPRLIASIRESRPIRLAGPEGMRLNPLHAADMAGAVATALTIEGKAILNAAGPEVLSIRDIAEALGAALGRAPSYEIMPATDENDIIGDASRLRERGWMPRITLRDAAAEICGDTGRLQ